MADERFASQVRKAQAWRPGEPMARWGDEDHLLVDQPVRGIPGCQVGVNGPEHEVDLPVVQRGEQRGNQPGTQGEGHAGVAGVEGGEGGG